MLSFFILIVVVLILCSVSIALIACFLKNFSQNESKSNITYNNDNMTQDSDCEDILNNDSNKIIPFSKYDENKITTESTNIQPDKKIKTAEEIPLVCELTYAKYSIITSKKKVHFALHEACHAVVGYILGFVIVKITILAENYVGGYTNWNYKEQDPDVEECKQRLQVFLAGYAGDLLFLGLRKTGSSYDNKMAMDLSRAMVFKHGMTNQGPSTVNPVTDAIITKFEEKYVIPFVDEAFAKVTVILKDNENFVKKFAKLVEERKTIQGEELMEILEKMQLECKKQRITKKK